MAQDGHSSIKFNKKVGRRYGNVAERLLLLKFVVEERHFFKLELIVAKNEGASLQLLTYMLKYRYDNQKVCGFAGGKCSVYAHFLCCPISLRAAFLL